MAQNKSQGTTGRQCLYLRSASVRTPVSSDKSYFSSIKAFTIGLDRIGETSHFKSQGQKLVSECDQSGNLCSIQHLLQAGNILSTYSSNPYEHSFVTTRQHSYCIVKKKVIKHHHPALIILTYIHPSLRFVFITSRKKQKTLQLSLHSFINIYFFYLSSLSVCLLSLIIKFSTCLFCHSHVASFKGPLSTRQVFTEVLLCAGVFAVGGKDLQVTCDGISDS